MIVLDTHAWLWWAAARERLSARARRAIEEEDAVGVCTISAWEVAMLVLRGRIALDREVGLWIRHALAHERVKALPLSADVAVRAALLQQEGFAGDPVDQIVYATARTLGAPLVSKDRSMRAFDPRWTVW